jgi:hypothetical protein
MKKLILLIILIAFSCSENPHVIGQTANTEENFFKYVSSLKLPNDLELCGERIPMEIDEVRQRAEREFYILLQQPGQIILYIKRSERYFPTFEKVIRMHNMPEDLKYLAVAESALYQATSSVGAHGIWQFMEGTGRDMGLMINDYVDERRHPEKSTNAAMKYLKYGYEKHNSWLLTLAGYNMGHTRVSRSLEYQSADDYFDLFLNSETSRFIFRIAIIKELMQNAEKYGFIIPKHERYQPRKTKTIEINTNISDIAEWAEKKGTTYKYVKLLNPWILKRELPYPRKGTSWEIEIPVDDPEN